MKISESLLTKPMSVVVYWQRDYDSALEKARPVQPSLRGVCAIEYGKLNLIIITNVHPASRSNSTFLYKNLSTWLHFVEIGAVECCASPANRRQPWASVIRSAVKIFDESHWAEIKFNNEIKARDLNAFTSLSFVILLCMPLALS